MLICKHREVDAHRILVEGELMKIDADGCIWRIAHQRMAPSGRYFAIPCLRRRAESRNSDGYFAIGLRDGRDRFKVLAHRLVWFHHNGRIPDGLTINHKNGVRTDNRLSNLEVLDMSGQMLHALHVLGTYPPQDGQHNHAAKLKSDDVDLIRILRGRERAHVLAQRFGVSESHIRRIWRGARWPRSLEVAHG